MENQTLLQKIRSVKYCLMAHPHNEPDSEFADRIDDLQDIEDSLESPPPIQTVEEAFRSFIRTEHLTDKWNKFFEDNYGAEHQARQQPVREKALDFLHSKGIESATCYTNKDTYYIKDLANLIEEYAKSSKPQQPVRKTLDECKDEVANDYSCESFDQLLWRMADGEDMDGYKNILDEVAELYAQTKAVEPQQTLDGWVSVKDGLPEYGKKVLVMGEQKGMNPQMGGAYPCISVRQNLKGTMLEKRAPNHQDENQFQMMAYVTHWMPLPEPPTQPNN